MSQPLGEMSPRELGDEYVWLHQRLDRAIREGDVTMRRLIESRMTEVGSERRSRRG